jgi:16S rRNA (guanine527-N7)-methyltransferase
MREEFIAAIERHQASFGLALTDVQTARLTDYYELVQEHNPLLHLVAPCSAEEFAIRHIFESLKMLEYLPANARFADVGSGAGLPSIPCLIVRDDLQAVLIESKVKKAGFLQTVFAKCELGNRAEVINRQFSELKKPDVSYVSCRALDRFTERVPQLLKWSGKSSMLLFGGPNLRTKLKECGRRFEETLMPMSEQRFLFVAAGT